MFCQCDGDGFFYIDTVMTLAIVNFKSQPFKKCHVCRCIGHQSWLWQFLYTLEYCQNHFIVFIQRKHHIWWCERTIMTFPMLINFWWDCICHSEVQEASLFMSMQMKHTLFTLYFCTQIVHSKWLWQLSGHSDRASPLLLHFMLMVLQKNVFFFPFIYLWSLFPEWTGLPR